MEDDGLPNARPIALSDSPDCQRSHNSVFSAAVKPRRYPCHIAKHSIFAVKDKVLRRSVETTSNSGQTLVRLECPLSANGLNRSRDRVLRRAARATGYWDVSVLS